jgi:hypothetical protein
MQALCFREAAAFVLMLALATELLVPAAYASSYQEPSQSSAGKKAEAVYFQEPVVTPASATQPVNVGGCSVSAMSDADRLKWWALTGRFQAQELTSMDAAALKRNQVGVKPGGVAPEVLAFNLAQVAALLGMKPEDVAKALGKSVNDTLTESDIRYLETLEKKPGLYADLQRLLGQAPKTGAETAPYENYKFTMPGGQTVKLKDFLEMTAIDNCSFGSSEIQGKVSYAVMLDKNLRLGFDQSQSTSSYPGSHLTSTSTTAYFGEMSDTVVVPELYRQYVVSVNRWNYIDLLSSLVVGTAAYIGAESVETSIKRQEEIRKSIENVLAGRKETAKFAVQIVPDDVVKLGQVRAVAGGLDPEIILANPPVISQISQATGLPVDEVKRIASLEKGIGSLSEAASAGAQDSLTEMTQRISKMKTEEKVLRTAADVLAARATTAFYYGMAWMGPARFALEATSGFFFQTRYPSPKTDQYMDVYANTKVLSDFRAATGFMGLGTLMGAASNILSIGPPDKAFQIGQVALVNQAGEAASPEGSSTAISWTGNQWAIRTNWRDNSEAAMVENIINEKAYSSLALYTKDMDTGAKLNQRTLNTGYYKLLALAAPLLTWRIFTRTALPLGGLRVLTQLATFDLVVNNFVNPHEWSEGDICSKDKMDTFLNWYKFWVVAGMIETVATAKFIGPLTQALQVANVVPAWQVLVKSIGVVPMVVDPVEIAKMVITSKGFEYLSACKDTSYTIVAYQKLETGKRGVSLNQTIENSGLGGVLNKLNLGQLLAGAGQKIEQAQLKDVMNFKGFFENQQGQVNAPKLLYVHADAAAINWRDVYAQLDKQGCLRESFVGRDGTAWVRDGAGWRLINTSTGSAIDSFSGGDWSDRALFSQTHTALSSVLTPNRIITTPSISGCSSDALKVNSNGLVSTACPSIACVGDAVNEVTGITSDVSAALGRVVTISTDAASGSIGNGAARFYRTVNKTVEGSEEKAGTEYRFDSDASLTVAGDGTVKLSGKTMAGESKEVSLGKLTSIITESGHIEVVPSTGQLKILVKQLAFANAGQNIRGITTGSNPGALFTINNIAPQDAASKEFTDKLQKALDKIQAGVGFQSLETEKMRYDLLKDAQGNQVLRVTNKDTGESMDYKVTGQIRKEGNDVVVPTDKGDFRFTIGTDEGGRPVVSVTGPDGIKEVLAALLAARGPGGVLAFDPNTGNWYAFNAQDLPMNPNFAKNGISWFGGTDGAKGLPTENAFAIPRATQAASVSPLGAFSFPSFAEGLLGVAMVALIVLGVLAVRVRARAGAARGKRR